MALSVHCAGRLEAENGNAHTSWKASQAEESKVQEVIQRHVQELQHELATVLHPIKRATKRLS